MRATIVVLFLVLALAGCSKSAPDAAGAAGGAGGAAAAADDQPATQPDSEGMVIPPGQEALLLAVFSPEGGLPEGWTFAGAEVARDTATVSYSVGGKTAGLVLRHPDRGPKDGVKPVFQNAAFGLYATEAAAGVDFSPLFAKLQPGFDRAATDWKWVTPKSLARRAEIEAAASAPPPPAYVTPGGGVPHKDEPPAPGAPAPVAPPPAPGAPAPVAPASAPGAPAPVAPPPAPGAPAPVAPASAPGAPAPVAPPPAPAPAAQ